MRSVFVDRHRLGDAGVYFRTATGDLGIPCVCGAGLGFRIEAADQFERKSGTFLDGKTEDLGEDLGGGHWLKSGSFATAPGTLLQRVTRSWSVVLTSVSVDDGVISTRNTNVKGPIRT